MNKIKITNESAGKRIDKFLSEEFFSISRGEIIRQIKKGKILINQKNVKPSYALVQDDVVEIDFEIKKPELVSNNKLKIKILLEDENIIAIDKPAGIQMHPSATEKENTISNWILSNYPYIKEVHDESAEGYLRPGIVHRLDRDTSGVVLIAKTMKSFLELKRIFAEREIVKKYVTLLFGNLQERKGVIEKPIARSSDFKRQKIAIGKIKGKARSAITEYKVLESYNGFDLVEARPKTGRTHQIRIHFFSIGHPVVGDNKYVLKKYASLQPYCVKRQLLHAREIKFEMFDKKYEIFSEIPKDFYKCLAYID